MKYRRFITYAWFVVLYTVAVILWGAVVRATGSGAGCGRHWPVCNGEIIHRPESVATLIELSHRLTSSLTGFLIIILLVWAFRVFPKASLVRRGALLSFVFVVIEGGFGALLVLAELVEDNASVWRAVAIGLHLINTLILLYWAVLVAWAAHDPTRQFTAPHKHSRLLWGAMIALCVVSSAGAITALGDTLFPAESLAQGIAADLDPTQNFLVQLRVWHPALAVLVSGYLMWMASRIHEENLSPFAERLTNAVYGVVILQLLVGILNIFLLVPVWMQIIHLLVADTLWIVIVLLAFEVRSGHAYTTKPS